MDSKVTDQTGQMPRLKADLSLRWGHTHFVGFVMSRLICFYGGIEDIVPKLLSNTHCICYAHVLCSYQGPWVSY